MIHFPGEVVTLITGEIGVVEFVNEETATCEVLLNNGNIIPCYYYEIL